MQSSMAPSLRQRAVDRRETSAHPAGAHNPLGASEVNANRFCHASAFTHRYDTTYASDPVVRQDLLCSRDAGSVDAPAKLGRTCVCWCVGQEGAGMRWYWAQGSGDDMRDVVLEPEGVVLGSRRC
jgi:hypothetical protein